MVWSALPQSEEAAGWVPAASSFDLGARVNQRQLASMPIVASFFEITRFPKRTDTRTKQFCGKPLDASPSHLSLYAMPG